MDEDQFKRPHAPMKISGNEVRPGNVLLEDNRLWAVLRAQHTQPGKGGAYMSVVLKDLRDGTKRDTRYRAAESVERVFIDEGEYEFLYKDGDSYIFMNPETYEQIPLGESAFTVSIDFLQPSMRVKISFYESTPLFVTLPAQVALEVVEADPVVKGQTATSSYKPARLSNGIKTLVPPHIETGTMVLINTEDASYAERVK
jgi:elongation factor P